MAAEEKGWTDQGIEVVIGNLLRAGVMLSAFVVAVGAIIYLVRHGYEPVEYRVFRGEPAELRSVTGIFKETLSLRGRAIIQFGLLLLIATPVSRVAFSVVAFEKERDRMYVVFTLIVLAVLLYSLLSSI
ncbi:MAG TPA: DUF1634 domain-containing protein [Candidatus Sulfotelmatobacter sp.]|nr:DUF1634 domain-containing protein [Candidatus Sulfotelmatobacter sp.]